MGGTRTAIRNMKDAHTRGMAPDQNFLGTGAVDFETPGMEYQNGLTNFRDERFGEQLTGLSEKKYAQNDFLRAFSKNDSKEYKRVVNTLSTVTANMNNTFSDSIEENNRIIMSAFGRYSDLIDACKVYLKKGKGLTESGRRRKEKVRNILELAQMDMDHLTYLYYDATRVGDGQKDILSGYTWKELLSDARETQIEVENLSKKTAFGSGVKKGGSAGRILDEGMFSPEEFDVQRIVKDMNTKPGHLSINSFSAMDEKKTKKGSVISYGFKDGEKVNLGKRNVATSRVANMLGLKDLIAQSKSVKVHDQSTGNVIQGNLMEKASGKDAYEAETETRNVLRAIADYNERENAAYNKISPMLQKQFSSLQVLDYICGQGDRNNQNFFVDKTEETYDKITGIDNDMSFSTGEDLEAEMRKRKSFVVYLKMVVDSNNNLVIPHMDRSLAENILNISDSDFTFALKDLIEPDMITHALNRLHRVQAGIEKEIDKGENSHVLLNDNEWNRSTHDDFMGATFMYRNNVNGLRKDNISGTSSKYKFAPQIKHLGNVDEIYDAYKGDSYYSRYLLSIMGIGAAGNLIYD